MPKIWEEPGGRSTRCGNLRKAEFLGGIFGKFRIGKFEIFRLPAAQTGFNQHPAPLGLVVVAACVPVDGGGVIPMPARSEKTAPPVDAFANTFSVDNVK